MFVAVKGCCDCLPDAAVILVQRTSCGGVTAKITIMELFQCIVQSPLFFSCAFFMFCLFFTVCRGRPALCIVLCCITAVTHFGGNQIFCCCKKRACGLNGTLEQVVCTGQKKGLHRIWQ